MHYQQLSLNMASRLENQFDCIKNCRGVYGQNSTVNSVPVDDWTAELAIISSNDMSLKNALKEFPENFKKFLR